jgi:hypothetical protein
MIWSTTLNGSPASGEYVGPWLPADGSIQIGTVVSVQNSDIFLEASEDGKTVSNSTEAPGQGYRATPSLSGANFYRIRYTNGPTADIDPILIGITTGAPPSSPVPAPTGTGSLLVSTGPGTWAEHVADPVEGDGAVLSQDSSQTDGVTWGPAETVIDAWYGGANIGVAPNTPTNIVSVDLPAGTYNLHGQVSFADTVTGNGLFAVYATPDDAGAPATALVGAEWQAAAIGQGITLSFTKKIVLAADTTVFLVIVTNLGGNVWGEGNFLPFGQITGITAARIG